MNLLTHKELYCVAKVLQSVLFSDDKGLFHGCNFCKHQKECMPDGIPHPRMIFDKARISLAKTTAVNLNTMHKRNVFDDITNP